MKALIVGNSFAQDTMEPESTHAEMASYGGDQALMYQNLTTVTRDIVAPTAGLDVVSPAGTAVQNARTVVTKKLTPDNFHLCYGLGRYIATLTFLKAAYNLDLNKVTWRPSDVTAEEAEIAKRAAVAACTTPYADTSLK